MKTQLLQDINDSHDHAAPAPVVAPREAPRTAPLQGTCGPEAPSPAAEPAPPPSPPPAPAEFEGFAFGFDSMDALPSYAAPRKSWIDRWARKVAAATMVVIAAILLAVVGAWFYRESMDARSMVVLAKQAIPERTGPAVPSVAAGTSAALATKSATTNGIAASQTAASTAPASTAPGPAPGPETKPEPAEALPPSSASAATPGGKEPAAEPARATNAPLPEPPARKEGDKAATARLARAPAGTAGNNRDNRDSEKRGPDTVAARNEAATEKRNKLAETLKQCRVAGYHEAQCLKRGCSMTRYGLACRG